MIWWKTVKMPHTRALTVALTVVRLSYECMLVFIQGRCWSWALCLTW